MSFTSARAMPMIAEAVLLVGKTCSMWAQIDDLAALSRAIFRGIGLPAKSAPMDATDQRP
jgi:hypothetical protein